MDKSVIDNIIIKHTTHKLTDYTGASLQSILTHSKTKLTYKLTIFFGYNKSKNSVSQTIEITEQQYLLLGQVIVDKNNQLLSNEQQILSNDDLFGVTTSLRRCNDPTNTNTINTITTTTITTTKEEGLLNEFSDELRPSVKLIIKHRNDMNKPITKRGIDMLMKKLKYYAEHWKISNKDALDFWLGENWQGIDIEYKYPFRVNDKGNTPQSFSEIKKVIEQKKTTKSKLPNLEELKLIALKEQRVANVH
jgi:hypothetical protein